MKKICFAGLVNETNLGDIAILECTERLYRDNIPEQANVSFTRLDLKHIETTVSWFHDFKLTLMSRFKMNLGPTKINKLISDAKATYLKDLRGSDLVVVVGGGLIKYKYQRFFIYLSALIQAAEKLNIPLVFNAVGVEGYDDQDFRCQLLKKYLNHHLVKSITTRDDIHTLSRSYLHPNQKTHVAQVADPAILANQVYNVEKSGARKIGIGIVRGKIFTDNGESLSADELATVFAQLILKLEQEKLPYQLFTNGLPADLELLPLIESKLGGRQLNVEVPQTSHHLVKIISQFSVVIAARLHANIIAYSLNVPSVGLVWNEKLNFFGHEIGFPERFISAERLVASNVLEIALRAEREGYDQTQRASYQTKAHAHIQHLVKRFMAGQL